MAKAHRQTTPAVRQEMSGIERLILRVSSMINHPVAQAQRWVTIHRLDTDGNREWDEVMSGLSETDELEMTINDEDDSVTLRWEAALDAEHPVEAEEAEEDAPSPF